MKPEEFVGRMIDVFTFHMGGFGNLQPKCFSAAAACIATSALGDCDIKENGYEFRLWTENVLDHIVIKAVMSDGVCALIASVCWNGVDERTDVPLLATWHPANRDTTNAGEALAEMVTMLTLKTNDRIRGEVF